ncbi:unnamed protein product [Symbiodinium necroappetens]|uniref:Uncharacterized protein n=1 Tax=Symbiodinium necroappetens TaxID=1628268 RepID=A0A812XAX2_9DINO|nr:unnamed protein product [Symbiodinium necroappetens]
MMQLGVLAAPTESGWFRLEPVTGPDVHAQLRLLLHLRRDAAGDKAIPPQCFQQLCQELLPKPSEDLQSGKNHLPTPLDGPALDGFPAGGPAGQCHRPACDYEDQAFDVMVCGPSSCAVR